MVPDGWLITLWFLLIRVNSEMKGIGLVQTYWLVRSRTFSTTESSTSSGGTHTISFPTDPRPQCPRKMHSVREYLKEHLENWQVNTVNGKDQQANGPSSFWKKSSLQAHRSSKKGFGSKSSYWYTVVAAREIHRQRKTQEQSTIAYTVSRNHRYNRKKDGVWNSPIDSQQLT